MLTSLISQELYLYMLIFLCHMYVYLIACVMNQFMDASLLCKLFSLLLLWMSTCLDEPTALDLSKMLGSEAMNLFFQEGLGGLHGKERWHTL